MECKNPLRYSTLVVGMKRINKIVESGTRKKPLLTVQKVEVVWEMFAPGAVKSIRQLKAFCLKYEFDRVDRLEVWQFNDLDHTAKIIAITPVTTTEK